MGLKEGLAWQFGPQFHASVLAGSQYAVLAYQVYGLKEDIWVSEIGVIPPCRLCSTENVELGIARTTASRTRTVTKVDREEEAMAEQSSGDLGLEGVASPGRTSRSLGL